MDNNFFSLFNQAVNFDIDHNLLDQKLHQLQKQYHPDNTDNSLSPQQAEAQSALINHAYQALKYPDSRASHLLELSGQIINLDNSISDLDFLDDAMEIRMSLDDLSSESNSIQLQQLKNELQHRIEQQSTRFKQAYQQTDWSSAIDATQKLKFLAKINKDIDKSLDDIANQYDDSDDDLYV